MGTFKEATAMHVAGPAEFGVDLDPQWAIGTKLHGGYLLALVARGAAELSDHPHLTAISGVFPSAPEPGPATVRVEVLKKGRSLTQLRSSLVQNGSVRVEALVTQGTLTEDDAWWSGMEKPPLPREEDCPRMPPEAPGLRVPLLEVVETRIDPAVLGFATGQPAKLGDGSAWDPISLLVALDPSPPVSLDLGVYGWAPTLQLSAYIRRLPAPGPVNVRLHANELGNDRMDETAFAWDSTGRLVGQSVQLAGVRLPRD
jgi:Acyl-CoA thioesterase C-terminal domain/Acyl-CoA thioesterase N-terminal domain